VEVEVASENIYPVPITFPAGRATKILPKIDLLEGLPKPKMTIPTVEVEETLC
jgi:hypothetical protein